MLSVLPMTAQLGPDQAIARLNDWHLMEQGPCRSIVVTIGVVMMMNPFCQDIKSNECAPALL